MKFSPVRRQIPKQTPPPAPPQEEPAPLPPMPRQAFDAGVACGFKRMRDQDGAGASVQQGHLIMASAPPAPPTGPMMRPASGAPTVFADGTGTGLGYALSNGRMTHTVFKYLGTGDWSSMHYDGISGRRSGDEHGGGGFMGFWPGFVQSVGYVNAYNKRSNIAVRGGGGMVVSGGTHCGAAEVPAGVTLPAGTRLLEVQHRPWSWLRALFFGGLSALSFLRLFGRGDRVRERSTTYTRVVEHRTFGKLVRPGDNKLVAQSKASWRALWRNPLPGLGVPKLGDVPMRIGETNTWTLDGMLAGMACLGPVCGNAGYDVNRHRRVRISVTRQANPDPQGADILAVSFQVGWQNDQGPFVAFPGAIVFGQRNSHQWQHGRSFHFTAQNEDACTAFLKALSEPSNARNLKAVEALSQAHPLTGADQIESLEAQFTASTAGAQLGMTGRFTLYPYFLPKFMGWGMADNGHHGGGTLRVRSAGHPEAIADFWTDHREQVRGYHGVASEDVLVNLVRAEANAPASLEVMARFDCTRATPDDLKYGVVAKWHAALGDAVTQNLGGPQIFGQRGYQAALNLSPEHLRALATVMNDTPEQLATAMEQSHLQHAPARNALREAMERLAERARTYRPGTPENDARFSQEAAASLRRMFEAVGHGAEQHSVALMAVLERLLPAPLKAMHVRQTSGLYQEPMERANTLSQRYDAGPALSDGVAGVRRRFKEVREAMQRIEAIRQAAAADGSVRGARLDTEFAEPIAQLQRLLAVPNPEQRRKIIEALQRSFTRGPMDAEIIAYLRHDTEQASIARAQALLAQQDDITTVRDQRMLAKELCLELKQQQAQLARGGFLYTRTQLRALRTELGTLLPALERRQQALAEEVKRSTASHWLADHAYA